MDVRDEAKIMSLPHRLPAGFQHVDILVNNAGLALGKSSADTLNMAEARNMMETNVMGTGSLRYP